jgi:hypothetical protein
MKQTWTDGLACVDRYNRTSAVLMTQEMMATFDAHNAETDLPKGANETMPGDSRTPAHAATVTRWMPTNSNSCSGVPSASRHSSMASRIRSVTSSRERACVWQPASWGTEAT